MHILHSNDLKRYLVIIQKLKHLSNGNIKFLKRLKKTLKSRKNSLAYALMELIMRNDHSMKNNIQIQ